MMTVKETTNPLFTVFTPVFNRKHTIHRVWNSLQSQTYNNFEWIVVNDGSTDGIEPILEDYKKKAKFPMRIYHQKNRGKHMAFNRAVEAALGELLVPADSDDSFVANTLETFQRQWSKYKADSISGISVLCMDEDDRIIGDKFPKEGLSNYIEMVYKYKVKGEKWGCIKVNVMKEFRFPSVEGNFFPESYVWSQIGLKYQTVYLNIPLRKYYQDAGNQIMKMKKPSLNNLKVKATYFTWWIYHVFPVASRYMSMRDRLKQFLSMWRYSILVDKSFVQVLKEIPSIKNKNLARITFLPSFLLFKILKWRPS